MNEWEIEWQKRRGEQTVKQTAKKSTRKSEIFPNEVRAISFPLATCSRSLSHFSSIRLSFSLSLSHQQILGWCLYTLKMLKKVLSSGYTIRTLIDIANHDRGTWRVSLPNFITTNSIWCCVHVLFKHQHSPYLSLVKVYYPISSFSSLSFILHYERTSARTHARTHACLRVHLSKCTRIYLCAR